MSLPNAAAVRVNWVPVSCMPSPESPANRIVTRSSCFSTGCAGWGGASVVTRLRALRGDHLLMGPRRQVEELLGERLGEVLQDVDGTHDADEQVVVVDEGHVPELAGLHELERAAHRLIELERVRVVDHQGLDGLVEG